MASSRENVTIVVKTFNNSTIVTINDPTHLDVFTFTIQAPDGLLTIANSTSIHNGGVSSHYECDEFMEEFILGVVEAFIA